MNELDRIIAAARAALSAREPSTLATILATRGSSFRRAGTRLWIGGAQRVGAISGGCLESDLAERSAEILRTGPRVIAYDSAADGDVLWGTASGCGGVLQILLEPMSAEALASLEWIQKELLARRRAVLVTEWDGAGATRRRFECSPEGDESLVAILAGRAFQTKRHAFAEEDGRIALAEMNLPPIAMTVFGSGSDARAAARLGDHLGWRVTLLPDTPATEDAFGRGDVLLDERSAILVMTHNFHRDADIAARVVPSGAAYVGMLGPRKRTVDVLADRGLDAAAIEALHAPPGLDIGGETPEEIALSLLAEIQAHFAGREGRKLRERSAPIHDRDCRVELSLLTADRRS